MRSTALRHWPASLTSSLAGTALAFVLWFRGVQALPTAAPPLLGLAAPVTGVVLGWLVRGETLTAVQLGGFAVVLGAITYGALMPPTGAPGASSITAVRSQPGSQRMSPLVRGCEHAVRIRCG